MTIKDKLQNSSLPRVSIIILTFNSEHFIEPCLDSVFKTTYPNFEIILTDNKSSDNTMHLARERYKHKPNIQFIVQRENLGFSAGNNAGARYASGAYLFFLNPDTQVEPDWLTKIVDFMEKDQSVGIVQPKILLMDRERFDSAGAFISPCGIPVVRGVRQEDVGQFEEICDIFYAKGAAFAIRRELWRELGGLDPIFFVYNEETDLCWRAWDSSYRVVYYPNSVVYHFGGGILTSVPYLVKYHEARGRLILLLKNHVIWNVAKYLPVTLILYWLNIIRYFLTRNADAVKGIIKGCLWCIKNSTAIMQTRLARKPPIKNKSLAFEKMVHEMKWVS